MSSIYNKTLIAAAVGALLSAPAWSANGPSAVFQKDADLNKVALNTEPTPASGTITTGAMPSQHQTENYILVERASGIQSRQQSSSQSSRQAQEREDKQKAQAKHSDHALYSRTPDDLKGMDVLARNGDTIGSIKTVVMGHDRENVHAVISSGGVLGIGSREITVPLSELQFKGDDAIQSNLTENDVKRRHEFDEDRYGVMESDRRISDFSAFAAKKPGTRQQSSRDHYDSDSKHQQSASARSSRDQQSEDARSSRHTADRAHQLNNRTPENLKGMTVKGSDGEDLGKVDSIVSSRSSGQIYAVIASGGFLGIGERKILVPLSELTVRDKDNLQARFSKEQVKSRPKYDSDQHSELDSKRPIRDQSRSDR